MAEGLEGRRHVQKAGEVIRHALREQARVEPVGSVSKGLHPGGQFFQAGGFVFLLFRLDELVRRQHVRGKHGFFRAGGRQEFPELPARFAGGDQYRVLVEVHFHGKQAFRHGTAGWFVPG